MSICSLVYQPQAHAYSDRGFFKGALGFRDDRPEPDDQSVVLMRALDVLSEGVILTNARARILYANETACALFTSGSLVVRNGLLGARASGETRDLQGLIAVQAQRPASDAYFRTKGPGCRHPVVLTVTGAQDGARGRPPVEPTVLILARDLTCATSPSTRMIALIFDLTPAEAKLANEMIRGDGLKAVALRLGITPNTARTHLNRVFDKTGTKRQAELVRLLLGCGRSAAGSRSVAPQLLNASA